MSIEDSDTAMIKNALDAAANNFPAELGRRVRQYREERGWPPVLMAASLNDLGVPMDVGDLIRLEEGDWKGSIDVRLLIALFFSLDVSTDKVIVACLTRAAGGAKISE